MSKKVNFYTVDLFHSSTDIKRDYKDIKALMIEIIEKNATKQKDYWTIDLTRDNDLHYIADIYEYEHSRLFMRLSCQKPSGTYIYRDYSTNIPEAVLDGSNEEKEGIEVYTYALLDYETGIMSIVNQQSAPSYKVIRHLFMKYKKEFYLEFVPIPNANGIERIYKATEPKISQIEVEVPVPNAVVLEKMFGWDAKDVLDLQGNSLKATLRLSSVERRVITSTEEETIGLLDCIKNGISAYNKARVRAKAEGIKTQDYSFFDENFSYKIDIPLYEPRSGHKHYFTAEELIFIYKDHLSMAYNENCHLLRSISNR
ncbi:MAG: hypothetical protein IJO60_08790 [Agathobacter sp.]|nr:hypothetical protein [Agathobacter sp.]